MATFTKEQVDRYFDRIELPSEYRSITSAEVDSSQGLKFLERLERYQLTTVPFENLSQHYNKHSTPVPALTDPKDLFNKIVGTGSNRHDGNLLGGRGGVCFENNILFGTILRTLGFNIYSVGGRVNHGSSFTTWEHMINLVKINGMQFAVDVGLGRGGQIKPMPLQDGLVHAHIGGAQARLVLKALPQHTDQSQRLWMHQYRESETSEWQDKYCFTEIEFLPVDFTAMSVLISLRRSSFFTHTLVMARLVRASEIGVTGSNADEIVGEIAGTTERVRRFIYGKEDRSVKFESEAQRLNILRDWFGIELSQEDQAGIEGTATHLKPA